MLNQDKTPRRRKKLRLLTIGTLGYTVYDVLEVANLPFTRTNGDAQVDKRERSASKTRGTGNSPNPLPGSIRGKKILTFSKAQRLTQRGVVVPNNSHQFHDSPSLSTNEQHNVIHEEEVGRAALVVENLSTRAMRPLSARESTSSTRIKRLG